MREVRWKKMEGKGRERREGRERRKGREGRERRERNIDIKQKLNKK